MISTSMHAGLADERASGCHSQSIRHKKGKLTSAMCRAAMDAGVMPDNLPAMTTYEHEHTGKNWQDKETGPGKSSKCSTKRLRGDCQCADVFMPVQSSEALRAVYYKASEPAAPSACVVLDIARQPWVHVGWVPVHAPMGTPWGLQAFGHLHPYQSHFSALSPTEVMHAMHHRIPFGAQQLPNGC